MTFKLEANPSFGVDRFIIGSYIIIINGSM